jgi:hypothetical protein
MKELYLCTLVKYMLSFLSTKKHFATQYHFPLLNLGQEWEIFRNLHIGNFCFFCIFQIKFTLCCHNLILNDIHDLITFITNKQNTKQIWV